MKTKINEFFSDNFSSAHAEHFIYKGKKVKFSIITKFFYVSARFYVGTKQAAETDSE